MSKLIKIEGYKNYFISEKGDVYSNNYTQKKILIPRENQRGYLYVNLSKNGKYKSKTIHRLVAKAFLSNPKSLQQVNHINGIKADNSVHNLEWCTAKENMKHAFINNLLKMPNTIGSKNGFSKLKEEDVIIIKGLLHKGIIESVISERFRVSRECINNIKYNRSWKHVKYLGICA